MLAVRAVCIGLLVGAWTAAAGCAGTPESDTAAPADTQDETQWAAAALENPFPGTYVRKGPKGEVLYCWREAKTGRRIPTEQCAVESVMRERAAAARQVLDDMRDAAGRGGCNPSVSGC